MWVDDHPRDQGGSSPTMRGHFDFIFSHCEIHNKDLVGVSYAHNGHFTMALVTSVAKKKRVLIHMVIVMAMCRFMRG